MTNLQAFLLGIMIAWTPSLLMLGFYCLTGAGRGTILKKHLSHIEGKD